MAQARVRNALPRRRSILRPDYSLSYATNGEPGPNDPPDSSDKRVHPAGGLPRPRKRSEMAGIIRRRADGVCDRLSMCRKTSPSHSASAERDATTFGTASSLWRPAVRRCRTTSSSKWFSRRRAASRTARASRKSCSDRFQSLAGVFHAELYQLADLGPIDRDIFNAFRAVRGVAGHLARQEIGEKPVITNWDKLLVYLRATMAHKTVERFRLFSSTVPTCCLPTKCKTKEPSTIRRSILARS